MKCFEIIIKLLKFIYLRFLVILSSLIFILFFLIFFICENVERGSFWV